MAGTGFGGVYVDANAVAPATAREIAAIVEAGGASYVDGGIIGTPPVAPGFVDTEMTQGLKDEQRQQIVRRSALGRLAEIDDVANAVEFLLSDKAKNITGTVLTVDAGNTA